MTVTPDGGRVHVATASGVSVIDTRTKTVTGTVPIGERPSDLALDPVRKRVYASTSVGGFISVIDMDVDTEIRRIPTNGHPSALAVSPDGSRLYASDLVVSAVMVSATDSGQPVGTPIPVDSDPVGLLVTPDGRRVVATGFQSRTVTVIGALTPTVEAVIPP
ncbi:YncE family protein [Streptomyces sp. NPDC005017]|uniref:YncE family protein n=1 Tax=Streptomyces sp. NPDC005017 TaxID=3364706 RepID=UPI0036806DAA